MILTYFFIGVIFTCLVDLSIDYFNKTNRSHLLENLDWDNGQRVMCIIIWPFAMVVFILAFLKSFFN